MSKKVALITGASHRIGAQLTRTFHNAGFNIILHYHTSESEALALQKDLCGIRPDSVALLCLDLVNLDDWTGICESCLDHWGRVDVLVNNASSFFPTPIGKVTPEDWANLIGTNLRAPFFLSQALAPALKEVAGNIVNVIDIHGERPLKNYPVYSIAKAGLGMLTRSLAKELAPEVRVNGVSPGAILWPEKQAEVAETTKATIIRQIPLKRQGAPEDVATAVLFLSRDAPYVNGQILAIDGGRSLS